MIKPILLGLLWVPSAVFGQNAGACQRADQMDAGLIDWYGEHAVAESADGDLVLWRNHETRTWTLVVYHADGTACALDTGTDWPSEPETKPRHAALDP